MTTKVNNMDLRLSKASLQDMESYSEKIGEAEKRLVALVAHLKQIETVTKALKSHNLAATAGRRDQYLQGQQARAATSIDKTIFDGTAFGKELNQTKQRVSLSRQILALSKQQQAITLSESRTLTNSLQRIQKIHDVERLKLEIMASEFKMSSAMQAGDARRLNSATQMRQRLDDQLKVVKEQEKAQARLRAEQERAAKAQPKQTLTDSQMAARSRKMTQERLFGDGGAGLFQIQTGLLANYAILGQLRTGFTQAISFAVELDDAMKNLQAIVRITDNGMVGLKESIIATSEATKFTAVEVAQAAVTLGQAGLSVDNIKESLHAITLLATATGTDLNRAVDIATSTIGVFNMESSQMGHVANVMTEAVNSSKLNIEKLTLGLQYAGNMASQSGVQFEELTAALGAMANAGIRSGSTLGTGTRQILVALQKPSERYLEILKNIGLTTYDVDLKTKSLYDVMKTLKSAGFSSADAIQAFEVRAAAAFNALSNNLDGMLALEDSFIRTQAAGEANDTQMRSLANQWKRFGSILGSVVATGMEPTLLATRDIVSAVSDFLEKIRQSAPEIRQVTTAVTALMTAFAGYKVIRLTIGLLAAMGSAILPSKAALAAIATGFTVTQATAGGLAATLGALKAAFISMIPGVGQIIAILGALGLAWYSTKGAAEAFSKEQNRLNDQIDVQKAALERSEGEAQKYADQINVVSGKIKELTNRQNTLNNDSAALNREIDNVRRQFAGMGYDVSGVVTNVGDLIGKLRNLRGQLAKDYTLKIQTVIGNIEGLIALQKISKNEALSGVMPGWTEGNLNGGNDSLNILSEISDPNTTTERRVQLQSLISQLAVEASNQMQNPDNNQLAQANAERSAKVFTRALKANQTALGADDAIASLQTQMDTARTSAISMDQRQTPGFQIQENQVNSLEKRIGEELAKIEKAFPNDAVKRAQAVEQYTAPLLATIRQQIEGNTNNPNLTDENKALLNDALAGTVSTLENARQGAYEDSSTANQGSARLQERRYSNTMDLRMSEIRQADNSEQIDAARTSALKAAQDVMMAQKAAVNATRRPGQLGYTAAQQNEIDMIDFNYQTQQERINNAASERQQSLDSRGGDGGAGAVDKRGFNLLMENFKSRQSVARGKMRTGEAGAAETVATLEETVALAQKELDIRQASIQTMQERALAGKLSKTEQKELTQQVSEEKTLLGFVREEQEKILKLREQNGLIQFDINNVVKKYADDALSLNKILTDGVVKVLGAVQSGFTDMWTAFTEGSMSAKDALKGWVVSMLKAINQVISQLLIAYLLKKALSAFFPDAGITEAMDLSQAFAAAMGGKKMGGFIRRASGGTVPGTLARDSVPTLLMPGEYVMRKSAVDMIGTDTLDQMNSLGNRHMAKGGNVGPMGKKDGIATTNVYVVSPDQQPTLGPNDIIAVISDDMARGGQTRRLVKSIQAGAL